MNTRLYKKVHLQAIEMLKAADDNNDEVFIRLYEELKALCYQHEHDDSKNHPVQWETLADFTEDDTPALAIYNKALIYAEAIQAHDYIASICYAMAQLLNNNGVLNNNEVLKNDNTEQALLMARRAHKHAAKSEDQELQQEIKALLNTFEE